jgi:hypothetical protein
MTKSYEDVIVGFPPMLEMLAYRIQCSFLDDPNHCIIIKYSDGEKHHIPWHSDKQEGTTTNGAKDICANTNIYNIILYEDGVNRQFQVAFADKIDKKADGHGEATEYVYNERTPNGDMVVLSASGNNLMKHRVPKEKGNDVVRYSIVFRTIKRNV